MKILFICRVNVGRSQMAESLFKKYSDMEAISAGTKVSKDGPGKEGTRIADFPGAEYVVKCMKESENIDVSGQKNKQVNPKMLEGIDKIIIMAEPETIPEYLLKDERSEIWKVDDPRDHSYKYFCQTREQIKDLILKLISRIETNSQ